MTLMENVVTQPTGRGGNGETTAQGGRQYGKTSARGGVGVMGFKLCRARESWICNQFMCVVVVVVVVWEFKDRVPVTKTMAVQFFASGPSKEPLPLL